jgi:hypothetical protein
MAASLCNKCRAWLLLGVFSDRTRLAIEHRRQIQAVLGWSYRDHPRLQAAWALGRTARKPVSAPSPRLQMA